MREPNEDKYINKSISKQNFDPHNLLHTSANEEIQVLLENFRTLRDMKLGGFIFSFLPDASGSNLGSGTVVKRERIFCFSGKS